MTGGGGAGGSPLQRLCCRIPQSLGFRAVVVMDVTHARPPSCCHLPTESRSGSFPFCGKRQWLPHPGNSAGEMWGPSRKGTDANQTEPIQTQNRNTNKRKKNAICSASRVRLFRVKSWISHLLLFDLFLCLSLLIYKMGLYLVPIP